jgi:hypothetical protein
LAEAMDEKQKKLLDKILENFDSARTDRKDLEDGWLNDYKAYRGVLEPSASGRHKWRSRLFIPATFKAVEGIYPRGMLALFTVPDFFDVMPRESGDVDQAEIVKKLLEYYFEKMDLFTNFGRFFKQMLLYGTSVGKIYWQKDSMMKTSARSIFGIKLPPITEEIVKFDGPYFEPIDLWDFYTDPKVGDLSSWKIHRTWRTIDDLRASSIKYENLDEVEKMAAELKKEDSSQSERIYAAGRSLPKETRKGLVEILEYWNEDNSEVVTVANQGIIIKQRPNPFNHMDHPFIYGNYTMIPFEFYTPGVPASCRDLQWQLNDTTNQRMDNVNLILNRMFKVVKGMGVNLSQVVSKPGGILQMDSPEAVTPLETPDITQAAYLEATNIERKIEEVTGATKYTIGTGTETSRRTATEAKIQSLTGDERFNLMVRFLESQVIKPLIRKSYQLLQQFMTIDKVIRIVGAEGEKWITVNPEDIKSDYDFEPAGSVRTATRDAIQAQLINFLAIAQNNPTVNSTEILKRIWENFGFKDADRIIRSQEQMMQMASLQAGMGQGMGGPGPSGPSAPPTEGAPLRGGSPQEMPMGGMNRIAMGV